MYIAKLLFCAILTAILAAAATAQTLPSPPLSVLDSRPWEIGPLVQGGFGTSDRSSFHFLSGGMHLGKVLTPPAGPSLLRGQFEYGVEVDPYWQAFTPAPHLATASYVLDGRTYTEVVQIGGGTFSGVSITPIILRWRLRSRSPHRAVPWIQGAGGVVWTNHKFPPDVEVPKGTPGGTSVFNFTPQFGVGFDYFVRRRRSVFFAANAVHISSASLGDRNPGVNASVQFQLGYTWWK